LPQISLASKEDQKATGICYFCCTMIVGKRYRVGPNLACGNCVAKVAERAKAAAIAAATGTAGTGTVNAGGVAPGMVGVSTANLSMAGAGMAGAAAPSAGPVGTGTIGVVTPDAPQFARKEGSFIQGLVLGAAAALVGLAVYATFTIVTHFYFGWVALGVGWLVGSAIMFGSKGVGGTKYQIAAMVLTYAAISLAHIPILIARAIEHGGSDVDWAAMAPQLVLWGIASPFLELRKPVFGILGLVILFVGLRIAARVTAAKRQAARVL
jgi:hypothetical protein